MFHDTPIPSEFQQNNDNRVDLVLRIPGGDGHHVSLRVTFDHLKQALKDITLPAGYYDIAVDQDGRVYLDKTCVFTPKSLQVRDGAA